MGQIYKLKSLTVLDELGARTASLNMALDEAILRQASCPVLRFYQWCQPSVSFGYFEKFAETSQRFVGEQGDSIVFVRRPSGGGAVDHRHDLTYSLFIPRDEEASHWRGDRSYRWIHCCVLTALEQVGVEAELQTAPKEKSGNLCFENPVRYDLVNPQGQKIAGAGQRRSRSGLLHQGSILGLATQADWKVPFARALTQTIERITTPPDAWLCEAEKLMVNRYANDAWNKKR